MRAAVVQEWGKPLVINDVIQPKPGPGQVLVRIHVTGICQTDFQQLHGDQPGMLAAMKENGVTILGHEGIGTVAELGPYVTLLKKGDKVGISFLNFNCGRCEPCLTGYPQSCQNSRLTTVHVNGTYAEYAIVSERAALSVPPEIPEDEAAPLLCAGVTAYGALRKLVSELRLPPGKTVAIVGGGGGLGHYGIQLAKSFGYKVIGVDIGEDKLQFMSDLGADRVVDAHESDSAPKPAGDANAVIVFTPRISGYALASKLVGNMGAIVAVGCPPISEGAINIPPADLVNKGIRIIPSLVGSPQEFADLCGLYVEGKVKSHLSRKIDLSEINTLFEELGSSKYKGRAVATI